MTCQLSLDITQLADRSDRMIGNEISLVTHMGHMIHNFYIKEI